MDSSTYVITIEDCHYHYLFAMNEFNEDKLKVYSNDRGRKYVKLSLRFLYFIDSSDEIMAITRNLEQQIELVQILEGLAYTTRHISGGLLTRGNANPASVS